MIPSDKHKAGVSPRLPLALLLLLLVGVGLTFLLKPAGVEGGKERIPNQ
jgi:hypothetical protein